VVALPAFNATQSRKELVFNAALQLQREIQNAEFMAEPQLDLRRLKADSVAPRLKPSTAMKRAKREPKGQKVCVGFVH
jgi:hypothetical protein